MEWLTLILAIEFGFSPNSGFRMYEAPASVRDQVVVYMDSEVEAIFFEHIYIGGGAKIHSWKTLNGLDFKPIGVFFRTFAGIRFGVFDVGIRVYCQHPIVPWLTSFDYKPRWEAAHTEFFIRAEGRIGG